MTVTRQRSPEYPNFSLRRAVQRAEAIFKADRKNPIDRAVAAQHMGYGGKSGSADKALATMQHYGLLDRVGKGELRVSQRTVDIIHPANPDDRKRALAEAAFMPPLFKALNERFPDGVSSETLRSYLVRENFLDRAIAPITSAYTDTCAYLKQENAYESGGSSESVGAGLDPPEEEEEEPTYGGARVGDLVQWEAQGALQFETPKRVRQVSDDGLWVAVEGSETGVPMSEVIVEQRAVAPPPAAPNFPLDGALGRKVVTQDSGSEWLQLRVGPETKVTITANGDMGPKQIGKLIKLLEAQRLVLEDDDDLSDL